MSNPNLRFRRRVLLLIVLLFISIGSAYLLFHRSPVPPTIIAPLSANMPPDDMSWSYRYIPGSWGWLWRLKSFLSGPAQTVLIEANFIDLNKPPEGFLTDLLKDGTELANTNGIRAFSFTLDEVRNLRQRLNKPSSSEQSHVRIVSSPRIRTADSIGGTVTTSAAGANMQLGTFPRLRNNATDLTATILFTETSSAQTKTNLAIWIQSRIKNSCGLLLLDSHPSTDADTRRSAVLISSTFTSSEK